MIITNQETIISTLEDVVLSSLKDHIRVKSEQIVNKHLKEINKEIEESIASEISKIILSIQNYVSFESNKNQLIITVSKKDI